MKLRDFLPDVANTETRLTEKDSFFNKAYDEGFKGFVNRNYGGGLESKVQQYGIEQLYFDWLRQAYAYRRIN